MKKTNADPRAMQLLADQYGPKDGAYDEILRGEFGGELIDPAIALRAIEAALSEQVAASVAVPEGWQPIETAPKDNKRPLYLAVFDSMGELHQLDFNGGWDRLYEGHEAPEPYYWGWASEDGIEAPTHWAYQDGPPPRAAAPVSPERATHEGREA